MGGGEGKEDGRKLGEVEGVRTEVEGSGLEKGEEERDETRRGR